MKCGVTLTAVVFTIILCLASSNALSDGGQAVITYLEAGKQRIYAFVVGSGSHLHVNYWDGTQWKWADQGTPQGAQIWSRPVTTTYRDVAGKQRIYAFVSGSDGHLHANYWDGAQWNWADQGYPPGTTPGIPPLSPTAAITYPQPAGPCTGNLCMVSVSQRIYVFISGGQDLNYWDGAQWKWAHQGQGGFGMNAPGVITYLEANKQRIYAFGLANDNHLYVNYWDGTQWKWADQGRPPGITNPIILGGWPVQPGVVTFRDDAVRQRIYAFTTNYNNDVGAGFRLYVNYWDGTQWKWADQGAPPGTKILMDEPSVITYREGGKQRIYAFVTGSDGHLYVNYWDGTQWKWADQGTRPGGVGLVGVITYREAGKQRIYAFVTGGDGHLYVNYWDGTQWKWADQGQIP